MTLAAESPREATILRLESAMASGVVELIDLGGKVTRWIFHPCGGRGWYSALSRDPLRPVSICCHVAIDGTLRCSAAGEFGEFFTGPRGR